MVINTALVLDDTVTILVHQHNGYVDSRVISSLDLIHRKEKGLVIAR